jgi:hypothetical protein
MKQLLLGMNNKGLHYQTWPLIDRFVTAVFARYSFQIVNCNEFYVKQQMKISC